MNINPTLIDWATPPGALLFLLPLILAALAWRRRQKLAAWADPQLLPWAVAAAGEHRRDWRRALDWLAWALLALAAAGPRLPLDDASTADAPTAARHVMSVMIALDVSASMAATDVAPDRLQRARLELVDFAARLKGERLGLLLHAGRAGVMLPPTDDTALLLRAIDQAGMDLIEEPGSNVAAALDVAAIALAKEKTRSRAVLLLTDADADSLTGAAGEAARNAAVKLKAAGIPLYVLALASPGGGAIPLADGGLAQRDGGEVLSRPDARGYGDLAQITSGRYVNVADGDSDWASLYDSGIAQLPADAIAPDRVRAWQPLFGWPLGLALVLFLLAHLPPTWRRRTAPAAALLLALIFSSGHEAQANDTRQAAWQAYQAERWGEAEKLYAGIGGAAVYDGQMGAGASAWKLKNYGRATRHFGAALLLARDARQRNAALYNLGNAHYATTRWQAAAEAYRAVLLAEPNNEAAAANLVRAETQLRKRRDLDPMKTDLRLRPGYQAQAGEVLLDGGREGPELEFDKGPAGPQVDRGGAAGAVLSGEQAAARQAALDARRLQSGLAKLERLEQRPRALLRGLLRQDTPPDATSVELSPW